MIKRDRGDPVRRDRRMSVGWTNGLEIGRRVFFFFYLEWGYAGRKC